METIKIIRTKYEDVVKMGDPRMDGWFIIDTPMPTIILCISYIWIATYLGPKFMKNREPYNFQKIIIVYNFFQVIFSAYITYEVAMSGWLSHYNFACQPVEWNSDPRSMRMVNISYWYFMSKFVDFIDTFFFILRKKERNLSVLHIFHHGIMPFSSFVGIRYTPTGHNTFSGMLNSFVHVFMYLYYMLAAMGPKYQKYVWWKKYLTSLQMVQFVLVVSHDFQLLFRECDYPRFFMWWNGSHAVLFFFMFYDFYTKAYNKRSPKGGQAAGVTNGSSSSLQNRTNSSIVRNGHTEIANGHSKTSTGNDSSDNGPVAFHNRIRKRNENNSSESRSTGQ